MDRIEKVARVPSYNKWLEYLAAPFKSCQSELSTPTKKSTASLGLLKYFLPWRKSELFRQFSVVEKVNNLAAGADFL